MPELRVLFHKVFDPIWANGHLKRDEAYAMLCGRLGFRTHAKTMTLKQLRQAIIEARALYLNYNPIPKNLIKLMEDIPNDYHNTKQN